MDLYVSALIFLIPFLSSCSGTEVSTRVPVNVSSITIPKEGQVDETVEIDVTAQANNGCYNDLRVTLEEKDNEHFLITATAQYHSNSMCSQQIVTQDTTIAFRPDKTGKYYFQINEYPFPVKQDTLTIK